MNNIDRIRDFLSSDGELLVVTHFFPDGDAIGSLLAFGGILDQLNVPHILSIDDIVPKKYAFLPGASTIRNLRQQPLNRIFPRVAVLDAGALPRIGAAQKCIGPDTKVLNIDHHFTGKYYGDINVIEVNASATAELLYQLCLDLDLNFTPQVAYGLYVGILTDTGRFRFTNTNAESLKICGDLVGRGVKPGWVNENVYYNFPFNMIKALAKTLSTIKLHCDGLVCLLQLDGTEFLDQSEGFVEYAASIQGVVLSAFVCEMKHGVFKVSLRSRCVVDVSEVARRFGGGGHRKAAGFRYIGGQNDLIDSLVNEFKREIDTNEIKPDSVQSEVPPEEIESFNEWLHEWSSAWNSDISSNETRNERSPVPGSDNTD